MCSRFRARKPIGLLLAAACALSACRHSGDGGVPVGEAGHNPNNTAVSTLFPGGGAAPPTAAAAAQYDGDVHAIAEGKRLFGWYNCSGCHFSGAGGIGPALMDDDWIYGGSMDAVFASIYQGRPNGMPAWGAKLSTEEIWQLSAYVRSLSRDAASKTMPLQPPAATPADAAREPDAPEPPAAVPGSP